MAFDLMELVKDARRVGITGHIKPDGDCIGSCLALKLFIQKLLPDSVVELFLETPEPVFAQIPGRESIITDFPDRSPFDVFIVCDTNYERTGGAKKYFDAASKTINIDHHISNKNGTGMFCHVVPDAAAAGEIVCSLIPDEYMDTDIALLLYMAIAHDTGVFRFSNTSPSTMRTAARLMEYSFDFSKLLDDTFFSCTMVQNMLVSRVLLESRFYLDKQVIVGSVDLDVMKSLGATKDDTGVVVERLRNTDHVACAVFIYEKEPGIFKASLRSSTDRANVAKVGEVFGGGGHVRASGCDYQGDLKVFEAAIIAELEKQLGTSYPADTTGGIG